ncbi:MAG: hypothetical protein WAU07_05680 [Microgenomates group bacterium]
MTTKLKIYYTILAISLVTTIGYTLFSGGTTVFNTQKIAELKKEQQLLLQEQQLLQRQIAEKSSISQIPAETLSRFESISNPIVIEDYSTVAIIKQN